MIQIYSIHCKESVILHFCQFIGPKSQNFPNHGGKFVKLVISCCFCDRFYSIVMLSYQLFENVYQVSNFDNILSRFLLIMNNLQIKLCYDKLKFCVSFSLTLNPANFKAPVREKFQNIGGNISRSNQKQKQIKLCFDKCYCWIQLNRCHAVEIAKIWNRK